jgi:peptidoglycan hydrolase CwlO-like protein
MKQDEFEREKQTLAKKVSTLLAIGKDLAQQKKEINSEAHTKDGFFSKWRKKRELGS